MSTINKSLHHRKGTPDEMRAELWEKIGGPEFIDENYELFDAQVLVATYVRPKTHSSGYKDLDKTTAEDLHQGKVGMIIGHGPLAFRVLDRESGEMVDDPGFPKGPPEIGDFVTYRTHDGAMQSVNGHECRILERKHIRGRIKNPNTVI